MKKHPRFGVLLLSAIAFPFILWALKGVTSPAMLLLSFLVPLVAGAGAHLYALRALASVPGLRSYTGVWSDALAYLPGRLTTATDLRIPYKGGYLPVDIVLTLKSVGELYDRTTDLQFPRTRLPILQSGGSRFVCFAGAGPLSGKVTLVTIEGQSYSEETLASSPLALLDLLLPLRD